MEKQKELDIYNIILKYPPFLTSRRRNKTTDIKHYLRNGGYIHATADCAVTVEDAEKMFAAILLSFQPYRMKHGAIDVVSCYVYLSDIKKLCNTHDYNSIFDSLQHIAKLTITQTDEKGKTIQITHMLHKVVRLEGNEGVIQMLLDYDFYAYCKNKATSLTIDVQKYIQLNPITKNLYSFIITNSNNVFYEDTLIERALIQVSRRDKAQAMLKNALQELKDAYVIKDYELITKNKQRMYRIERFHEELATAGGKPTP